MLQVLAPYLRIRGHLPAPTINGGEDGLLKWSNFQLSRARDIDLDFGSGHTAYHHASTFTYIPNFIEIHTTFTPKSPVIF